MAGQLITFTPKPLIITTGAYTMPGPESLDTLGSTGKLAMLFRFYANATAATVDIKVQTALTQSTDNMDWVDVATQTGYSVALAGATLKLDVSPLLLRYVRWTYSTAAVTTMVVEVNGVLW